MWVLGGIGACVVGPNMRTMGPIGMRSLTARVDSARPSASPRGERAGKEGGVVDPKWEWADSFTGAVLGAVMGFLSMLGWVSGKMQLLHNRINKTNDLVGDHAVDLATLTAHHEANVKFQHRIDETLERLTAQNGEQLRLLAELKGLVSNHRGQ